MSLQQEMTTALKANCHYNQPMKSMCRFRTINHKNQQGTQANNQPNEIKKEKIVT